MGAARVSGWVVGFGVRRRTWVVRFVLDIDNFFLPQLFSLESGKSFCGSTF